MQWILPFRGFEAIKFGFFSENIENPGAAPEGRCEFQLFDFKIKPEGVWQIHPVDL